MNVIINEGNLTNFSSVCSIPVELFDFDNLSYQLQATKHMISNIQIHTRVPDGNNNTMRDPSKNSPQGQDY